MPTVTLNKSPTPYIVTLVSPKSLLVLNRLIGRAIPFLLEQVDLHFPCRFGLVFVELYNSGRTELQVGQKNSLCTVGKEQRRFARGSVNLGP